MFVQRKLQHVHAEHLLHPPERKRPAQTITDIRNALQLWLSSLDTATRVNALASSCHMALLHI
jgi:hypothetical protein